MNKITAWALLVVVGWTLVALLSITFPYRPSEVEEPDWERIEAAIERMEYLIELTEQRIETLNQMQSMEVK